jgi:hypothetical protein
MRRPEPSGNFLSEAPLGIFSHAALLFSASKRPEVGFASLLSDNQEIIF